MADPRARALFLSVLMAGIAGFGAQPASAHDLCVSPLVVSSVCWSDLLEGDPPAPDLCDDWDDDWDLVYSTDPRKDAYMVPSTTVAPFSTAIIYTGEMTYHAEVWKCQDRDFANEVEYFGFKTGYGGGTGASDPGDWAYRDIHHEDWVECFYAPFVDFGQVLCEAWADKPPEYTDYEAYLTIYGLVGADVYAYGAGHWDSATGGAGGLLDVVWQGEFDGTAPICVDPYGCLIAPVHAEITAANLPIN